MKTIFLFLLLFDVTSALLAQSVTIDAANPSNIIQAQSINQGILVPKITSFQKNQIPLLQRIVGMMIFDIDAKQFSYWSGTDWINIGNISTSNGITLNGTTVKLGGTLTENTTFTGTTDIDFNNTGSFKIANLGGSGTQMVVTDNTGIVGKQPIPIAESTTTSNGISLNGTTVKLGGTMTENTTFTGTTDIDFNNTGSFKIANLGGSGTQMVVTDNIGIVGKQPIPIAESTTASNGITLNGTTVKLGGTLTENTTFTGTTDIDFNNTGSFKIANLGGSGTQMVVTDNIGIVGKQPISIAESTTASNGISLNGTTVKLGGTMTENTTFTGTTDIDFNNTGSFKIANLGGSGTQMVVTDNTGIVGKQPIPIAESTTASNGITLNGTTVKLGGTLTENTIFTGTTDIDFNNTGSFKIANLSGSGTQMVVTDNTGIVGKQPIPIAESTTASNGITLNGTTVKLGGTLTENTIFTGTTDINFNNTGSFKIANLGGSGTQMVVTDNTGIVGKQPISWFQSGAAGNEIKNTNSGGFWSERGTGILLSSAPATIAVIPPITGSGTRLMWIANRSAFRVGTVVNEWDNTAANPIGNWSFASGYRSNAKGDYSTVFGNNSFANGDYSTVFGNNSFANYAHGIAMGNSCLADNIAAIAIGQSNLSYGQGSIAAGVSNKTGGGYSGEVAIGTSNQASNGIGAVAIGNGNVANGNGSVAMGKNSSATTSALESGGSTAIGFSNQALGVGSTALGSFAVASGSRSIAVGHHISTGGFQGAFVISDRGPTTSSPVFTANAENRFFARFANGYWLQTSGSQVAEAGSSGVFIDAGGSSWSTISDSTKKENFVKIDGESMLQKISKMRAETWNYKGQNPKKFRHYGVMAQEFHKAFGTDAIGTIGNDVSIASADMDGVIFVLIQALEKRTQKLQEENAALRIQILNQQTIINRIMKIENLFNENSKLSDLEKSNNLEMNAYR